jgi:hypothetical protein
MGSDAKVLVRKKDEQTATRLALLGFEVEPAGEWLDLGDREESLARTLSISLATTTVYWVIHTVTDVVMIVCYDQGQAVRNVTYTADDGWSQSGPRQPFEGKSLSSKWMRKRRIMASPDGYGVLETFLGNEPPPVVKVKNVKDPDANSELYLPPLLVAEVSTLAKVRKVPVGALLAVAWELTKGAVFEQRVREDGPVELVPPLPGRPAAELVFPEAAVAALDLTGTDTVKCAVVLPPDTIKELKRMQGEFGYAMKELLRDAYVLARPRLGLA